MHACMHACMHALMILTCYNHGNLRKEMHVCSIILCITIPQVPTNHFSGNMQNLITELYHPMQAAIQGMLTGPGANDTL